MVDDYTARRIAAIATAKIDGLIDEMRRRVPILDMEERDIGVKILAYTEAKVAVLEAVLKSCEPPALIALAPPEQASIPGIADTNAPRPRARRVSAGTVVNYLVDRDGSTDVSYIIRDFFAGHRNPEHCCRQMLMRLVNRGYIALDWADGRMVRATLRRYPEKEA